MTHEEMKSLSEIAHRFTREHMYSMMFEREEIIRKKLEIISHEEMEQQRLEEEEFEKTLEEIGHVDYLQEFPKQNSTSQVKCLKRSKF